MMRFFDFPIAAVAAAVITIIIRFTVFTDDCNLFVVGITFLFTLIICYGVAVLTRSWCTNKKSL